MLQRPSQAPGVFAAVGLPPVVWLFALFLAPLAVIWAYSFGENRTLVERMVQTFVESLQGIAVTKAFGREPEDRARFDAANRAVLDQQQVIFWRVSLFSPAIGFLTRINMMVLLGYGAAFYLLSVTLRTMPVGIAYALWSGIGQVLVMFIAWVMYRQMLDAAAFVGIGFILTGVLVLALFSKSMPH